MVRTEGNLGRLVLLATALALVLLVFGLVGAVSASSHDLPEHEIQPRTQKVIPSVFTDSERGMMPKCPLGFRICRDQDPTENAPSVPLPLGETLATAGGTGGLTSGLEPIDELVGVSTSPIRCPDRMCPDGGTGCYCRGTGIPTLTQ